MSTNIYEENGLVPSTVDTASVDAVASVATSATSTSTGASESVSATVTIGSGATALSVTTTATTYLAPQTDTTTLTNNLSSALADESSTAALKASLSTAVEDENTQAAVNGTILVVNDTIAAIQDSLSTSGMDEATQRVVSSLLSSMALNTVPDGEMTQGDVVVAQAMSNLIAEAASTLTSVDVSDSASIQAALDLIDQATTVAKATAALSSTNSDFMSGVNLGDLIAGFTSSRSAGRSRGTVSLTDASSYISTINAIAPKIFSAMGVKKTEGVYSITEDVWDAFVARQSQYRAAMQLGMAPIDIYGLSTLKGKGFDEDTLGIDANTLVTYLLSVVFTEANSLYGNDAYTTVTTFLSNNPKLVSGTLTASDAIVYPELPTVDEEAKTRLKAALGVARSMNSVGIGISQVGEYLTDDLIDDLFSSGSDE
ncbi:MAG: hypothetical protein LKE28_08500 [Sphaerochaeta sp.]|nr:hypothetical protein [Sphaerochaeta sp.]